MTGHRVADSVEQEKIIEALLKPTPPLDLVLSALQTESWRLRRTAAEAASRLADQDEATRALLDLAVRGSPDTRASVAEAILEIGPAAIPVLNEALLSGSHQMPVRRFIVEVLGTIASPASLDVLAAALEDADANVRMSAAEALGQVGGAQATKALIKRLGRDDFMVTSAIAQAIWKLRAHVDFETATRLLDDKRLLRPAMKLLGLTKDPRAIQPMIDALASKARPRREAAILASAQFLSRSDGRLADNFNEQARKQRKELAESLSKTLRKGSSTLQGAALDVAAVLAWPELLFDILSLAAEPETGDLALAAAANILMRHGVPSKLDIEKLDPDMRSSLYLAAAHAARVTGKDIRLAGLTAGARIDLRSSPPETARAAAALLGEVGDQSDIEPMIELARATRDDVLGLDEICASLGELGRKHPETATDLLSRLPDTELAPILPSVAAHMHAPHLQELVGRLAESEQKAMKTAGMLALAHLPCGNTTERLIFDHLESPDPVVRALAARALQPGCSDDLLEAVSRLLADADARVRRAACFGLGRSNRLDAAHPIIALIDGGDGADVLAEALSALIRLGGRLEKRLLVPLIQHEDIRLAKAALEVSRSGEPDPMIADSAIGLLNHERWDLRAEALRTIAHHGSKEQVQAVLHRILQQEQDETVLDVATKILAKR